MQGRASVAGRRRFWGAYPIGVGISAWPEAMAADDPGNRAHFVDQRGIEGIRDIPAGCPADMPWCLDDRRPWRQSRPCETHARHGPGLLLAPWRNPEFSGPSSRGSRLGSRTVNIPAGPEGRKILAQGVSRGTASHSGFPQPRKGRKSLGGSKGWDHVRSEIPKDRGIGRRPFAPLGLPGIFRALVPRLTPWAKI
jgi:hypothetical protein